MDTDKNGYPTTDADLLRMDRPALFNAVVRLRDAIRKHRDCSAHDLCWFHPELWSLLPEGYDPKPAVPPVCEFLEKCIAYRKSLEPKSGESSEKTSC